jgi:hypothetical protein
MIGTVARRSVPVAIEPLLARQESIESRQQVVIGACPDLDDHQPGRRVGHEDRQEPVAAIRGRGREPGTVAGQVDQSPAAAGPDRQLAGLYGKMLRMASRRRPIPPPAGADS